eukprot:351184-Chlamydomonas_euryale.AAC.1
MASRSKRALACHGLAHAGPARPEARALHPDRRRMDGMTVRLNWVTVLDKLLLRASPRSAHPKGARGRPHALASGVRAERLDGVTTRSAEAAAAATAAPGVRSAARGSHRAFHATLTRWGRA